MYLFINAKKTYLEFASRLGGEEAEGDGDCQEINSPRLKFILNLLQIIKITEIIKSFNFSRDIFTNLQFLKILNSISYA